MPSTQEYFTSRFSQFPRFCMKLSFSKISLLSFFESRKKSEVKDHLLPHLNQTNSSLIGIHSETIGHQDGASIFSNSKNKFNFYYLLKFAKKFTSKKINYGNIIYFINLSSNLPTRVFILSSSAFHSSHTVFIAPKNYCFIFTAPHYPFIRESYQI